MADEVVESLPEEVSEMDKLRLAAAHYKNDASQLALMASPIGQQAKKVHEELMALAKEIQQKYQMKDTDSVDVETGKIVRK